MPWGCLVGKLVACQISQNYQEVNREPQEMCLIKAIAVVGFLMLLGPHRAVSQWSNICNDEADGTRLPLPMNCRRFLVCAERDVAEIRSCPRGLHFNAELGECDFQWRANCIGSSLFAGDGSDDECTCACCADECNTNVPETETSTPCDPEDTTQSGEDKTTKSVEEDTSASSDAAETTLDPESSESTSENETTATTAVPTQTTSNPSGNQAPAYCSDKRDQCADQPDGAYIQMKDVCTRYIRCTHGCVQEMPCPGGLYFDVQTNMCNHPQDVDCTPASSDGEVAGPSGVSCNDQGVCAGQRDGKMFADPDSNGYFICQCQCPIARPCDTNTKFNQTAQVCDWDTRPGSAANVLCPEGLVYNATSDECDYPPGYVPVVTCDNDSDVCLNQPEGTLFSVEGFCNKFYKCNFNCAVEQLCPNNLVYDNRIKMCTYPQNYECPWKYTPPSGPNAGPSGIACESNGRCQGKLEGTLLPSLTNCSGYSVCQCECEIPKECGPGLYWDVTLSTCNYANKVNCSH